MAKWIKRKIVDFKDLDQGAICKKCLRKCEVVEVIKKPDECWEFSNCCGKRFRYWTLDIKGNKKWYHDEGRTFDD